jgi:hypothetical protein
VRLENNHWTCSSDVVELIEWTSKRREHQPAHRSIKCLEGGKYRTLWTAASGGKSYESTTPAPLAIADIAASRAASETTTDIAAKLTRLPFSSKIGSHLSLHPAKETAATGRDEPTATPEIEAGGSDGLFSWNAKTNPVFVILCALCVIVLALMAFYFNKRIHRLQDAIKGTVDFFTCRPYFSADIKKDYAEYIDINNQRIPYAKYHICEEIDECSIY